MREVRLSMGVMLVLAVAGGIGGCRKPQAPADDKTKVVKPVPVKPTDQQPKVVPASFRPLLPTADQPPEAELMHLLDNAPWTPDGPHASRQVYVISAPWCGVCKALYRATHGKVDGVQFRWIEVGARGERSENLATLAATLRDTKVLDAIDGAEIELPAVTPGLRANVLNYDDWLQNRVEELSAKFTQSKFAYPTLIWMQADGVHVNVGMPDPLDDDFFKAVAERPEAASMEPGDAHLVAMRFNRGRVSGSYYSNTDGVKAYPLPDENAPVAKTYARNYGGEALSRVEVNGQAWIELQYWDGVTDRGLFIREQDLHQQ